MGCSSSSPESAVLQEQRKQDQKVRKELVEAKVQANKVHKLLLLGSGDSGKSTLFRQLQFIYMSGFEPSERLIFVNKIHEQLIDAMKLMVVGCRDMYEDGDTQYMLYDYEHEDETKGDVQDAAMYVESYVGQSLNSELLSAMRLLWDHPKIQSIYQIRNILHVPESSKYFFDGLDRITQPKYIPTNEDMLLVRSRTTGYQEKSFSIEHNWFSIVDVGGQRSERKKWIEFFDNVTAVLFVLSLSCYDELTFESEENSMSEAIAVYDSQVNGKTFAETPFILFLNKSDLFFDKITSVPIKECPDFQSYDGPDHDETASLNYIRDYLMEVNQYQDRDVFQHVTNSTNKDNIRKVFNDVQTMIISSSLAETGLG